MAAHDPEIPSHHVKQSICATRKPYREGRHPKAVKVYTVNNESRYILIQGVPSVGAKQNLVDLCSKFGAVDEHHALDEYPCEDKYTEVYLFKYKRIQSARFAKKKLDDYSFFGGTLHVCYAPEYETASETREKLLDRRRVVASKIRQHEAAQQASSVKTALPANTMLVTDTETASNVAGSGDLSSGYNNRNMGLNHSTQISASTTPALLQQSLPPPPPPTYPSSHSTVNSSVHPPGSSFSAPYPLTSHSWQISAPAQTFELPPPPRTSSFIPHSIRGRQKYEFSRVPSAHATLPTGFDGRLETTRLTPTSTSIKSTANLQVSDKSNAHPQVSEMTFPIPSSSPVTSNAVKTKSGTSTVIVKDYKKPGPAPRFVPRQAIKRNASSIDASEPPGQKKTDRLDHEIRQNAFQLGQVQGPEAVHKVDKGPPVPPALNKSVTETIHAIRNKISQVINDSVKKQT